MNTGEDTIAAIATSLGEAGIAIVRISGPEAFRIADAVFSCRGAKPSARPAQSFVYGYVVDGEVVIDEALLLVMRAPRTYTCEDMVEIQGHGGPVQARRVLRRVLAEGARLAEPGEFTRRAFLNGRIDLVQAEAVLDLIHSRSERAAQAALEQLEGTLSSEFNALYDRLLSISADIEASLDFVEEDIPLLVLEEQSVKLAEVRDSIQRLLCSWDEGHLLRDGILAVISGSPNVGKSTLLNALLGADRAIVSHVPGTTRDTIEEMIVLDGIPVRLVDTAGLRDTGCEIEQQGIQRTQREMLRADLHLCVIDASSPLDEAAHRQIERLNPANSLVVLNKMDNVTREIPEIPDPLSVVTATLKDGIGVGEIRNAMRQLIERGIDMQTRPHALISERHRELLTRTINDINEADALMKQKREDLIVPTADYLRSALHTLGQATGRVYGDELLNTIFSRFCVGK
ncbi:MAG: tRNA uridine-5-carboxymethylaminomethyl(34) synthesis GTPase MnmE [Spartobacteria bacterium]|nr:tRNA uridine-5-carboxymethylaminomethyl(34) synthesis GTPase MnmE [Spartobacteria bacterium]